MMKVVMVLVIDPGSIDDRMGCGMWTTISDAFRFFFSTARERIFVW